MTDNRDLNMFPPATEVSAGGAIEQESITVDTLEFVCSKHSGFAVHVGLFVPLHSLSVPLRVISQVQYWCEAGGTGGRSRGGHPCTVDAVLFSEAQTRSPVWQQQIHHYWPEPVKEVFDSWLDEDEIFYSLCLESVPITQPADLRYKDLSPASRPNGTEPEPSSRRFRLGKITHRRAFQPGPIPGWDTLDGGQLSQARPSRPPSAMPSDLTGFDVPPTASITFRVILVTMSDTQDVQGVSDAQRPISPTDTIRTASTADWLGNSAFDPFPLRRRVSIVLTPLTRARSSDGTGTSWLTLTPSTDGRRSSHNSPGVPRHPSLAFSWAPSEPSHMIAEEPEREAAAGQSEPPAWRPVEWDEPRASDEEEGEPS